jgi:hypothetical protein
VVGLLNDDMEEVRREVNKQRLARLGALLPPGIMQEGTCEHCKKVGRVQQAQVRTAYADDSNNTAPIVCEECLKNYNDYWDEMWSCPPGQPLLTRWNEAEGCYKMEESKNRYWRDWSKPK